MCGLCPSLYYVNSQGHLARPQTSLHLSLQKSPVRWFEPRSVAIQDDSLVSDELGVGPGCQHRHVNGEQTTGASTANISNTLQTNMPLFTHRRRHPVYILACSDLLMSSQILDKFKFDLMVVLDENTKPYSLCKPSCLYFDYAVFIMHGAT